MAQVQTESVLVVPAKLFHRLGHFQGFTSEIERYLPELFAAEHTSFRPRHEVEEDPGFKQLIPYVIFRYRDPNGQTLLFQYTRGKGQGEGRLHSKKSIGIGGHISLDDCGSEGDSQTSTYQEGMRRELAEEVAIDTPYDQLCVGLINDDESPVGRVHLGVVHLFDVERPAVQPLEHDIVDASFRPVIDIVETRHELETWSQICLDALVGDQINPARKLP